MNRTIKLILLFAPLAIFFSVFIVIMVDLRQPVTMTDRCVVAAVGTEVWPLRGQGPYIYKHGGNVLHDLALRCEHGGLMLLNDEQLSLTPVKQGQPVDLTVKTYRYLPKRWLLGIHTGRP
jgi:hypothetical protein